MFIIAELNQLKRFSDYKEFVAVFQCKSEKGNSLLRAMEPPRHDDFEPQRLDEKERRKAQAALKEIGAWVRDMLKVYARNPVSEETTIDELAEYFADEDETSGDKKTRGKERDPEAPIIVRARPLNNKPKIEYDVGGNFTTDIDGDGDSEDDAGFGGRKGGSSNPPQGGGGNDGGGGGGNGGGAGGDGDDDGGQGPGGDNSSGTGVSKGRINITLENVRAVPIDSIHRQLFFMTRHTGEISLQIQVSGADFDYPLDIIGTTVGNISDGRIVGIPVKNGVRVGLNVTLGRPFTGAVRISANAV